MKLRKTLCAAQTALTNDVSTKVRPLTRAYLKAADQAYRPKSRYNAQTMEGDLYQITTSQGRRGQARKPICDQR